MKSGHLTCRMDVLQICWIIWKKWKKSIRVKAHKKCLGKGGPFQTTTDVIGRTFSWSAFNAHQSDSFTQWAGGKTRPLIGSSCWIVNCRCVMCWQRLDTKTRLFNSWCQWKPHDQLNRKCVTPLLNPPSLAPPPLPPPSLCHRFHRLIFTEPGGTINPRWVSITSVCQQTKAWASFFYRAFFQALFRFSPAAALTAHWPTGEVPLDEMELNMTDALY